MKERSVIGLMVSLTIWATGSSPVLAQSQRYPTNAELRQLLRTFNTVPSSANLPTEDRRTLSEKRALESFVTSWSRVDPAVAPFLGQWGGIEESISIFPSNVRGRVCIIFMGSGESSADFDIGNVSNSQIRTNRSFGRSLIIRQGNRLGLAGIYRNGAGISAYEFPRPLRIPTNSSLLNLSNASRIIQQFNAAGCTNSLPNRR
ncbi:hypothetical protein [Microseira wollei]|uniref:Uncharacterized protein n=1 Tax=Microseira wollei NIES-4236 TaxID=2530354 RepID=A0AAV3XEB4_9CYAN|nr:hypothetical protein [Microseira wollei]GET37737.1 hypothetical protein MiSe_24910 [Microseira wollei NIES-4236]